MTTNAPGESGREQPRNIRGSPRRGPKNGPVSKPRGFISAGDCTPRIGNRSDALELVELLIQEVAHYHRKNYFLLHGLEALQDAIEREII